LSRDVTVMNEPLWFRVDGVALAAGHAQVEFFTPCRLHAAGVACLPPASIAFAVTSTGNAAQHDLLARSWKHNIAQGYAVRVYSGGEGFQAPWLDNLTYVHLAVLNNEDPPLINNFRVWGDMFSTVSANWYVRCDWDTFVDAHEVAGILAPLDSREAWYTGSQGSARPLNHDMIRKSFTFAKGGACEVVSVGAARRVAGMLSGCLLAARRMLPLSEHHPDVEFGRCLMQSGVRFAVTSVLSTHVVEDIYNIETGNASLVVSAALKQVLRQHVATVHPVKDPAIMMYLVDAVHRQLTPLYNGDAITPCMHNPHALAEVIGCPAEESRSLGACGFWLPECQPSTRALTRGPVLMRGSVVSHDVARASRGARVLSRALGMPCAFVSRVFGEYAFPKPVGQLMSKDMGFRATVRSIFSAAHRANAAAAAAGGEAEAVALFGDDLRMHKRAPELWHNLQGSARCGSFLRGPGGVLFLGAWQDGSAKARTLIGLDTDSMCYNALHDTKGSFAAIFSSHVVGDVLTWLDHSNSPFDDVYAYLVQRGYPVRVARPSILIYDVSRARSQNWELSNYEPL